MTCGPVFIRNFTFSWDCEVMLQHTEMGKTCLSPPCFHLSSVILYHINCAPHIKFISYRKFHNGCFFMEMASCQSLSKKYKKLFCRIQCSAFWDNYCLYNYFVCVHILITLKWDLYFESKYAACVTSCCSQRRQKLLRNRNLYFNIFMQSLWFFFLILNRFSLVQLLVTSMWFKEIKAAKRCSHLDSKSLNIKCSICM